MAMTIDRTNVHELLEPRKADGYLNATMMCKAYDKLLGNWLNNKSTDELLEALSFDIGIPISKDSASKSSSVDLL
ncbi:MAG: KilA-N domain-containing protein, partial [Deinococcota bacterium]